MYRLLPNLQSQALILRIKEGLHSLGLLVNYTLTKFKDEAQKVVEGRALALQNIRYKRNHLRSEIRDCWQLECRYLVATAREETGIDGSVVGHDGDFEIYVSTLNCK